ncbi:helix-turn-helix domain-containing protein [Bosea eneae]|uniref:Helix-turn-helix domain-containing protein n=1 Tax=Bosea eneae TaxID=151454 RepID=A0ABW0IVN5_9HYPH
MLPQEWRRASGLSQAEVAKLLGLEGKNPSRTWQRYETGERQPRPNVIVAVERISKGKVTARSWEMVRTQREKAA